MSLLSGMIRRELPAPANRLWLVSDLQQSEPAYAEAFMTCALRDFHALNLPVDAVCDLGDGVEGQDRAALDSMIRMQIDAFAEVDAPVYYVMGNHDFDLYRRATPRLPRLTLPLYEAVRDLPQWRVAPTAQDMAFHADIGAFRFFFLTDCGAEDGSWFLLHEEGLRGDASRCPHDAAAWRALRGEMAGCSRPVVTLSHYAMPGGNRASKRFAPLLPLPDTVRLHLFGHAHIGDSVWAGEMCFQRLWGVRGQPVPQANVSSLDHRRGTAVRSAFLELYDDTSLGLFFRNHTEARWEEAWFGAPNAQPPTR